MDWILWTIALCSAACLLWITRRLVTLREEAWTAWGDVDVLLRRRWILTLSIVAMVREARGAREETLTRAQLARNSASAAGAEGTPSQRAASESSLAAAISQLIEEAQSHANVRKDTTFRSIHDLLDDVAGALREATKRYNGAIEDYNRFLGRFPVGLLATIFRLEALGPFQQPPTRANDPQQLANTTSG